MMAFLPETRLRFTVPVPAVLTGLTIAAAIAAGGAALQGQTANYTLYTPEGKRTIVVRTGGTPETMALEQLTGAFGLTFTEDRLANGLVIGTRGQRIIAVPGQSFVQVAGRVVGLDAPLRRERNAWVASIDFLSKALGPAIGEPVVIRRASRIVLVGNVRVPQVGGRVERTASGARVVLTIQPATPHRVTREGNRLTVRFDAVALDATPLTGFIAEFATAAKVEGASLVIELGPSAAAFRAEDDRAQDALNIDLLPPAPVAPPPPPAGRPGAAPAAPQIDLSQGTIRTIVIDPGHGGDDEGTHGTGGTREKDLTLQVARRLKGVIESRMGLRVLLTRDGDDNVAIDRRTAFANNNKADLFLSLHANASVRGGVRGAQVFSLDLGSYPRESAAPDARARAVPVLGGGTRVIDPMPWDLAQIPFADQSATLAALIVRQLTERGVPLFGRPAVSAPMRVLVGANMPAVLIEVAFLSNTGDEKAVTTGDLPATIVEGIVAAITEVRRGIPGTEARRGGQ